MQEFTHQVIGALRSENKTFIPRWLTEISQKHGYKNATHDIMLDALCVSFLFFNLIM